MAEPKAMCLLHAEFHELGPACAEHLFTWYFEHIQVRGMGIEAARELYQWEVETAMLEKLFQEHRPRPLAAAGSAS